MGLFSGSAGYHRYLNKSFWILLILISCLGIGRTVSAQERIIIPSRSSAISSTQLQSNLMQRDTTMLEILGTINFRDIQLQPQQKRVLNLGNTISRVNSSELNQIDPDIIASMNRQEVFKFPEVHLENNSANAGVNLSSNGTGRIAYQPIITSLSPLVYNHTTKAFTSTLNFLLLSGDQASGNISSPMPIELHSDNLDAIEPNALQIGHLNLPSTSVRISAHDVRDSVQIRIVTENKTDGYEAYLKVEPALNLFTERRRVQGLGIQQIPVQLHWKGSSSGGSQLVNVSSSKGTVTPGSVELSYDQPATVFLRSEGLGEAILTASSTLAQSNTLELRYTFPWLFLIFSIAGGFLGGTVKYFTLSDKPKSFLSTTVGSLSVGLLGAVAYFVLGINLLNLEFSSTFNEFAVFGISALIAFFGIRKIGQKAK